MLVREIIIPDLEEAPPARRYWTDEEDAILRKYYGKVDVRYIVKELGRTKRAVENRASILELTYNKRRELP